MPGPTPKLKHDLDGVKHGENSTSAPTGSLRFHESAFKHIRPALGNTSATYTTGAVPQHSPSQIQKPPAEPQMGLHTKPRDYVDPPINRAGSHRSSIDSSPMEINTSANTCAAPQAKYNAKPAEFINLTPSSFSHTKPPSGYYTHIFQGKPVTVITDASCISHAVDGDTMFGLTPNALDWLEREQEFPPDPTRRPLYPPFSQLQPHQRVLSLAEAQQDWETRDQAHRAAPFPDPTLAQVLANAPQLVEDWYTAVIDLSQIRDTGHTLGCSYLTRRAGNGQLYTTPESIMMLFWKMLSIITEGVTKGHLKTTNVNQITRMRRHGFRSGLCAQQIIDDAIQSIRLEKMILVDLLGPGGKECMTNFVWCPKGYAEVKLYDRTCNMVRKFGGKRAMEKKMATTTVNTETLHTVEDPPSALDDSHTPPNTEASAAPPSQPPSVSTHTTRTATQPATPDRPSSLFPPWSALPPTSHLTTAAAASAHRATTDRLSRSPPRPDANLAAFRAHLPLFAAHLYTAVVSVSHVQDNPSSHAYTRFVRPPYSFPPTATTPAVRAIQSTCHRFCLSLARAAAAGYARPLAHDGSQPELRRHRAAFMAEVLADDEGGSDADVLQRFGAVCEAVRREKTIADAFRTGSCRDLKVADLLREPLAYALTKAAHRRSNRSRPERGGGGVGKGEGAGGDAKAPAKRRRRGEGDGKGAKVRSGVKRAADGVPQRGGKKRADALGDSVPQRSGAKRADASADGVPQRSGKKMAWDEDAQPAFRVKRQRPETAEGSMGVIDFKLKPEGKQRRDGGRNFKMEDRKPCDLSADAPILPQAAKSGGASGGFQGFKHHGLPMALVLAYMGGSGESGQVKTEQQLKVEQDVSTLMGDVLAESLD